MIKEKKEDFNQLSVLPICLSAFQTEQHLATFTFVSHLDSEINI
jgi:hypothetical protein